MKQNTKDWIQYSSAIFMLISAVTMAFISFFSLSTVVGGVLAFIAQALAFAAGVFGLSVYVRSKLENLEEFTAEYIDKKLGK